jgi:hypothetical protein
MIVAGIDEAGYGPLLGPLVVGASAFRVAEDRDLWRALGPIVTPKRDPTGRKIHVADSKAVYSTAAGLAPLELGVLAFAGAIGLPAGDLDELIAAVDPQAASWIARHPWYGRELDARFPIDIAPSSVGPRVNGVRSACAAADVVPIGMWARVLTEGRYNDLVGRTRNKGSALFSLAASLLDHLMQHHAHEPGGVRVVCDRQGGREHYGEPLRSMFPDWRMSVEEETPRCAIYTLTRGASTARIEFREKGESASLPTALASMLCKYLREGLMSRFNAWWLTRVPGLRPTAGYYTDGMRFLGDISEVRQRLAVPDGDLVRCR